LSVGFAVSALAEIGSENAERPFREEKASARL